MSSKTVADVKLSGLRWRTSSPSGHYTAPHAKHMLRSSCFVELLIQLGKFTASTYHVLFAADGDVSSLYFSFHSLHAGMFMMAATQLSGLNRLKRGLQAAVSTA